jgi:hypothetical protein
VQAFVCQQAERVSVHVLRAVRQACVGSAIATKRRCTICGTDAARISAYMPCPRRVCSLTTIRSS